MGKGHLFIHLSHFQFRLIDCMKNAYLRGQKWWQREWAYIVQVNNHLWQWQTCDDPTLTANHVSYPLEPQHEPDEFYSNRK